jgi:hypothetical protein
MKRVVTFLAVCCVSAPALAQAPQPAQEAAAKVAADAGTKSAAPAQAQLPAELAPQLSLTLTPSDGLTVGDVLKLKLEALVKNGVDVAVPEQSLAPFEAVDRRMHTEPLGEQQKFVFELDLLALEPGDLKLPALRVRVVGPKGELGETQTAQRTLHVKSLIANEPNAAPKPATKPVAVVQDDYTLAWVLGALGAAALVALITLLVSRYLSRRPKLEPPPPPPRPPWELALEKLDQLARRKEALLSAERGEEFIEGVSSALREYLGRRYGFDGLESTSDEIMKTLENLRPHKLSLSGVSLLLEQCDLVKFAQAKPDAEQCEDLMNGAVGLVRATTPAVQPQLVAAEAAP